MLMVMCVLQYRLIWFCNVHQHTSNIQRILKPWEQPCSSRSEQDFSPSALARQGDELKVEQGVKDLRSLSLPNMKPSAGQSPYILTPGSERAELGSLGRREGDDLLVSPIWARRRFYCQNLSPPEIHRALQTHPLPSSLAHSHDASGQR